MASMWKPLLAATLAVGRNTRLLTVGSSILAINAPILPTSKGASAQLSSAQLGSQQSNREVDEYPSESSDLLRGVSVAQLVEVLVLVGAPGWICWAETTHPYSCPASAL